MKQIETVLAAVAAVDCYQKVITVGEITSEYNFYINLKWHVCTKRGVKKTKVRLQYKFHNDFNNSRRASIRLFSPITLLNERQSFGHSTELSENFSSN